MFDYREMTLNDYEDSIELWKKTEGMGFLENDTTESLGFYLKRNLGMSFVCVEKEINSIVGTILGGHDGRRGYIYHLAVNPDYRGKSIGKTLIDLTVTKIKEAGLKRCLALVLDSNKNGIKFWEKINWNERDLIVYSLDL